MLELSFKEGHSSRVIGSSLSESQFMQPLTFHFRSNSKQKATLPDQRMQTVKAPPAMSSVHVTGLFSPQPRPSLIPLTAFGA
jgi:hypothetical protein